MTQLHEGRDRECMSDVEFGGGMEFRARDEESLVP